MKRKDLLHPSSKVQPTGFRPAGPGRCNVGAHYPGQMKDKVLQQPGLVYWTRARGFAVGRNTTGRVRARARCVDIANGERNFNRTCHKAYKKLILNKKQTKGMFI